MSIIKINNKVLEDKSKKERIEELKKLLQNTDYKVLPDYDKDDEDVLSQRQLWRSEIRLLESQL
jgi:hypothetical protein